jgi:diguanylate cyclase (GGDEF)-like protein
MSWGATTMVDAAVGLRDALSPTVDAHAGSFLGRRWGGMTGPVWSLALWYGVMAAFMLANVLALDFSGAPLTVRVIAIVWWVAWTVLLVLLRDRTPSWLLHLLLDAGIILTCLISLTAANEVRSVSQMMFIIIPAVYAATWFGRQQMALHLLLLVIASGAVVLLRELSPDSGRVWVVLLVLTIGLAYFVNALVRHLNELAVIDPVTGLLNRAGLIAVAQGLVRRGTNGLPRTVAVLDLDGFKIVNDRDGHAAGDAVLDRVGTVMRTHLRPGDTMARTGGDEFVVLLTRTDLEHGAQIIERIVSELPIACSFGLSDWVLPQAIESALSDADAAMYKHKNANRAARPSNDQVAAP